MKCCEGAFSCSRLVIFFQALNGPSRAVVWATLQVCFAAIAAGRVPQSLVSFMQEAVTQIQSSILGPLTAFR